MFQVNPLHSSAKQRIQLKNQALFSSKDKSKISKCRLLQLLFGALRVTNSKIRGQFVTVSSGSLLFAKSAISIIYLQK